MKLFSLLFSFKIIFFFILFTIFLQFSFSSQIDSSYYADIEIEVSPTGLVTISGITNFEDFQNIQTHKYTSKNGEMWLLNISVDELFSDYLFRLILPEYSTVNYIKTTPNIRFETLNSKLNIVGVGQNRKFELIVQYSFKEDKNNQSDQIIFNDIQTIIIILLVLSLLIFTIFFVFKIRKNSLTIQNNPQNLNIKYEEDDHKGTQKNIKENDLTDTHKFSYIQNIENIEKKYSYLPLRQREIISILCKEKQITQKALEKRLNIPKSSVSRNVHSLVIKKIITKKESGNTNILEFHESILKPEK